MRHLVSQLHGTVGAPQDVGMFDQQAQMGMNTHDTHVMLSEEEEEEDEESELEAPASNK